MPRYSVERDILFDAFVMSDEAIAVWTRVFDVLERGNAERYEATEQPTPASIKDSIL